MVRLVWATAGAVWLGTALAQVSEEEELALTYGDKDTVSIATGEKQTLRRAPSIATVITAEDIAAMGATDLDEVMETVPGVHVARSANLYAPLYIFRGIYTQANTETLMLLNGVPMTTLYAGNRGNIWGGLPLENVARIEVIRGPGSALYGADAFSGVINIITKTAADTPGTEFGVRAGSFNSKDAWIQHGGQLGSVDVAAYLRVGRTDGLRNMVTADAQTRYDSLLHTSASLAPSPVNTGHDAIDASLTLGYENWRVNMGYKDRDNVGTGAGIAYALDPVGKAGSRRFNADLSWADAKISRDWGAGFTASYLHYEQLIPDYFQLLPPGANVGGGAFGSAGAIGAPFTWEEQKRLSAFATYSGFLGQKLRFSLGHDDLNLYRTAEYRNFTYAANGALVPNVGGALVDYSAGGLFLLPHRRKVDYGYVQDEWQVAQDWTLTGGVRRDVYSDVGGTTNPRLALVWDAAYDVTAKVLYGRAFRAPSFGEMYGATNPSNSGNASLRPETIHTMEAAVSWQARKDTQINVSVFHYVINDLILSIANAGGLGSTYQNVGNYNGKGAEVEAVWDASRSLRLTANYSFQRSFDLTHETDAGYAPHNHIYVRGDWRFAGGWMASAQVDRVGDRDRAFGDSRAALPNYTTVDLTLRTDRNAHGWGFAGSIRNLFNATVVEPSLAPGTSLPNDLPQAGRSLYLQATYAL